MKQEKKIKILVALFLLLWVAMMSVNSCVHAPYVLPESLRTNDPYICFERDILPIFISNCAKSGCHDARSNRSGYTLDSYSSIVRKGIVPGNSAASNLYASITIGKGEGGLMPKDAAALTWKQIDLIKRWIVAGAVDSGACTSTCDTANFTYSGAISPMMQLYCVGCHNAASAQGGSLTDYNSVKDAAVSGRLIGDIAHQTGYNAMPQTGLQLSDCQVTQVKKWVAAGALNN